MFLNHIFELTALLDSKSFYEILEVMRKRNSLRETDEGFIDESFENKGIAVVYRDSKYKKKIRLIVDTRILAGDGADDEKVSRKLNKRISEYFGGEYGINDFQLTGVYLSADIDVGSRKNVRSYLKVLKRIGKVKGFSPTVFERLKGTESFCLSGNSNGIDILLYDPKEVGINCGKPKGILRAEVRLTKTKAIQSYVDKANLSEQIVQLIKCGKGIFMDTFARVVPFGEFCKKDRAVEIIRREIDSPSMQKKMIRLVELIPEKKSVLLAQKALGSRDIEKVVKAFAQINLSPVTIGKRRETEHLRSLYELLG